MMVLEVAEVGIIAHEMGISAKRRFATRSCPNTRFCFKPQLDVQFY